MGRLFFRFLALNNGAELDCSIIACREGLHFALHSKWEVFYFTKVPLLGKTFGSLVAQHTVRIHGALDQRIWHRKFRIITV